MESLLWELRSGIFVVGICCLCCGIFCCGIFVVDASLLNRCGGVFDVVVEYVLLNLSCGIFWCGNVVVECLLWNLRC